MSALGVLTGDRIFFAMTMGQISAANPLIEAFLDNHQCLTAMPENSLRILKLLTNPNFSMRHLVKLIEQDAAVAAKVIQTVNSAAYAKANRISQLDRATAYLGFRTVKEIVVAISVQAICKPVTIGKYAIRDLWDHCLGVAVLCREFATRSKAVDPELAFLAGILHDVGLLLTSQSEVDTSFNLFTDAEDRKSPFCLVEESYFGFDHCELGFSVAGAWNFPADVSAVIRWHHDPTEAPAEFRPLCQLAFIADTLCVESGIGFPLTTSKQKITPALLNDAQLSRADVDDVLARFKMLLRLHQD
jgi:putative nucleotidyltransferase with HDIG domain